MIKIKHQFEEDIKKIKPLLDNEKFAKELYSALCNMQWINIEDSTKKYSCSWRYAGGLVAELRERGESYMDFYCSGNEGYVSPLVETILKEIGWIQYPYDDE